MNKKQKRAFTILELLISMFLVTLLMGPILNTFQVSERMSRRNYKSFAAQNLAGEMMSEIAKKSFDDPYQASTINVNLKPGPTHEEYIIDSLAPKIANGTEEVGGTGTPRMLNETLVNRSKYYNDIDDYDGYNTDETILPTLANGKEYTADGENPYANLRVKVEVKSSSAGAQPPEEVLKNGATLGGDPKGLAITPDGKYAAVINAGDKTMSMINLQTGYEVDCGPNNAGLVWLSETPCTSGLDRIPLTPPPGSSRFHNLGEPSKIITGPAGDRFYVLHKADILDPDNFSGVTSIDINNHNTPEVSFHRHYDGEHLISKDLRSNSINSIVTDTNGIVYAATNGGGLSQSGDNGESWSLQKLLLSDGVTMAHTIYCLASARQGIGQVTNKYVYAGGKGGLWILKNNGLWSRVNAVGTANITAIAAMDNGYVIAGADNGYMYVSKEYDTNFVQKTGPSVQKINALAIDDNYRVWSGNDTGQFYSENVFHASTVSWTAFMPAGVATAKVNSLYIDRSQTYPAPFTKVLDREVNPAAGLPCAPSLHANESGLHLFYLDNAGASGATDTSLSAARLWYVNSPDFGKSWNPPVRISHTINDGNNEWAHSAVIDKSGVIHVVWNCYTGTGSTGWQMFYQRSEDCGKTWLSSDVCIGNADYALSLDNLEHNTTAGAVKYASDKFNRIACTSGNQIYAAFSDNQYFTLRYSPDGGKTWPDSNLMRCTSPGRIESINVIEPLKKIMYIFITGTNREQRKMYYSDLDGKSFQLSSKLSVNGVTSDSAPPIFSDGLNFLYHFNTSNDINDGNNIYSGANYFSHYPYDVFKRNILYDGVFWARINVDVSYKSTYSRSRSYYFYKLKTVSGSSVNSGNAILLSRSESNAKNHLLPIHIDFPRSDFDSLTSAGFGSEIYFIKKSADPSPKSNFVLSSMSSQLLFSATSNNIFTSDINMAPVKNFDSYNFPDEKIRTFSGDGDGNMLYGTSRGLYVRNIHFSNINTWTSGSSVCRVHMPVKHLNYLWQHFFDGVNITFVYTEKNGTWWVGTSNKGIYKTNDYGTNWKHIEAIRSKITDIGYVGKGNANKINKLILTSKRINLADPDDLNSTFSEALISTYNLSNNQFENTTVVGRSLPDESAIKIASYDNSKNITYDTNVKKIYIKAHNRFYVTPVTTVYSPAYTYNSGPSDFTPSGILVKKNDTIEITANGKFGYGGSIPGLYSSGHANGFYTLYYTSNGSPGNFLCYKISEKPFNCYQYYKGHPVADGEIIYYAFTAQSLTNEGILSVQTIVESPAEIIDASAKMNSNVNAAFAAPDNKTVFYVNNTQGKVYSVSDINDTSSVQIKEFSENISNPSGIIFTPLNRNGDFKTYVVCAANIVDLFGNKLLPDISGLNISSALVNDNGDIYFIDTTTKKLYKCITSAHKTVYVTVKENDDTLAGSMPPVTLVRKFHNWQASNEIRRGNLANRSYIKYNYIYTSQKYPTGISASQSESWTPQQPGFYDSLNVYVVDSVLNVNGTLEIAAGTVVKFSTADKSTFLGNYSGKSNSSLIVSATGKLIIKGGAKGSEKVLFTSIDDNSSTPSVYNSSDLDHLSSDGKPNMQVVKNKSGIGWYCGPKFGDWGKSDGTTSNSPGGIFMADPSKSIIENLELRYGLIYSKGIYPGNVIPRNYNTANGIKNWTKSNVYIVDDTLEINHHTSLKIEQGAIVKFGTNAAIVCRPSYYPSNPTIFRYPYYSIIADGSPALPIHFTHISYKDVSGFYEGQTPNTGIGKWNGLYFKGLGDNHSIKHGFFGCMSSFDFNGSNAFFSNCDINSDKSPSTNKNFIFNMDNLDISTFHNNVFYIMFPGRIESKNSSINHFIDNYFHYYFNTGNGVSEDYMLSSGSNSVLVLQKCLFKEIEQPGFFPSQSFNGSKIKLSSSSYISQNKFRATSSTSAPVSIGTSCEISINSSPNSLVLPIIENNIFENCRHAIYLRGACFDTTSAILENRIVNNSFINCNEILRTEISNRGDFPESPAGAAIDLDGNVYITDDAAKMVYKYSPNGKLLMKFGSPGTGDGQFGAPAGIAVNDTGEIYVADSGSKRIQKFDRDGKFILKFGTAGTGSSQFNDPASITISEPATAETLFVTDRSRNTVMRFNNIGAFQGEFDSSSMLSPASLNNPGGLVASRDSEYLYVTDTDNHRVVKIKINLTTTEINLGEDYFNIEPRVFNVNNDLASWPLGFAPGDAVDEGGHIELNVTARKSDGTVNTAYTGTSKSGKIYIDPTVGVVTWEGTGITDNSAAATDNNAAYSNATFVNGAAKFYVRNTMAGANLKITIADNTNSEMRGSAEVSWTIENMPPALEFIGGNSKGFRRYTCKNDPGVTFIKIPSTVFDWINNPTTELKMSTYYIAETTITNMQFNKWRNFVGGGTPTLTGTWNWNADPSGTKGRDYPDHPAIYVSWEDSKNYSYWLLTGQNTGQNDKYLPTHAQYVKAMRGAKLNGVGNNATEKIWPWGIVWNNTKCNDSSINTGDERPLSGGLGTTKVFKYAVQCYYGLYDICGNTHEWCTDWYASPPVSTPLIDLKGPSSGTWRVLLGGSWMENFSSNCSCAYYGSGAASSSGNITVSFRPCFYWPLQ